MRMSRAPLMILALVVAAVPAGLAGQTGLLPEVAGSIVTRRPVAGAPVVATAENTLPRAGARRETWVAHQRFARDREGRVRVDQYAAVAPGQGPGALVRSVVQLDADPKSTVFVDHARREMVPGGAGMGLMLVGGGAYYVAPQAARESLSAHSAWLTAAFHGLDGEAVRHESLGSRLVAGVPAEGQRITVVLPAELEHNATPLEIVEERWYSTALQLTLLARLTDPRVGVAEYRVTSLSTVEPSSALFVRPDGYTDGAIRPEAPLSFASWLNPPMPSQPR